MTFDVSAVRALYPALADGHAYLDGAAGTQVPVPVIDAIADAYRAGIGNLDGAFAASQRSDSIVAQARAAVADLVGGTADGVVFGPSATALAYRISEALSRQWTTDDEIVVSRLDHDSNIRPWIQAAGRVGALVRWAEFDLVTGELPAEQYAELVGPRTRLVAVTAASNAIGTRPDVAAIAGYAHAVGALCYVDGVHATPHVPVDIAALGADFYATSAYKWSGPHVAALIADPALLETVWPDKLAPSSNAVPWRFERGTLPFADLAGVTAAVDHLAGLGDLGAGDAPGGGRVAPGADPRVDGGGRGPRGRRCSPGCSTGSAVRRRDPVRQGRQARAHRLLQRRRGGPRRGGRAPGFARRQRVGRRQLRVRALPGARPAVRGGGQGRPRALQRRLRRRPPAVRPGGPGRPLTAARCAPGDAGNGAGRAYDLRSYSILAERRRPTLMATGLPDGVLAALSWLWQLACHLPAVLAWADTPQRAALVTVAVLAVAVLAVELAGARAISASLAVAAGAIPVRRRVAALQRRSWRVAFLPQRDPDARGRSRPRAPSAAQAAA